MPNAVDVDKVPKLRPVVGAAEDAAGVPKKLGAVVAVDDPKRRLDD